MFVQYLDQANNLLNPQDKARHPRLQEELVIRQGYCDATFLLG
jgi:hypothetical protein